WRAAPGVTPCRSGALAPEVAGGSGLLGRPSCTPSVGERLFTLRIKRRGGYKSPSLGHLALTASLCHSTTAQQRRFGARHTQSVGSASAKAVRATCCRSKHVARSESGLCRGAQAEAIVPRLYRHYCPVLGATQLR